MLSNLSAWHLLILVFSIIPFALWIVALIQIGNSKASVAMTVIWVVIVTLLPLIGAIGWFIGGRRSVAQQPPAPPAPPAAP